MNSEFKLLKEWIVQYVKHKDLLLKSIQSIEENKQGWDLIVRTNTRENYYLVVPRLQNLDEVLKKINGQHVFVVVLNTKENLEKVIETWDELIKHAHLCIFFVNPASQLETKWIIYPHTHHKVTEKSSLKTGLKSMFSMVEPYTK